MKRHVLPRPVEGDRESASNANQKIDVRQAPEEPAEQAGQLEVLEFDDRRAPADSREVALMAIVELGCEWIAANARRDEGSHIASHLLCRGRESGHEPARRPVGRRRVADDEDGWCARHGEVGVDEDTTCPVARCARPLGGRRRDHAGGPDDGSGAQETAAKLDAVRTAIGDGARCAYLDAHLAQRIVGVLRKFFR